MKAILMSIKPKYVVKILNGEKTIEIRKTMPKCKFPIDVYIYCTKDKKLLFDREQGIYFVGIHNASLDKHSNDTDIFMNTVYEKESCDNLTGKVVAKFTLNKVEEIKQYIGVFWTWGGHPYYTDNVSEEKLLNRSCLSATELENYLQGKNGYAWHIDNLVIFDKPKELSEFRTRHWNSKNPFERDNVYELTRAPQSWCYVEVHKDVKH